MVEAYGLDPVRYFFLREVPFGQDGSYSHEAIVARMNADLANDIGNLAQRSLTMIAKAAADDARLAQGDAGEEDLEMLARADALLGEARRHMQSFALHLYIGAVFEVVSEANRYFANAEPWKLAKSDPGAHGARALRDDRNLAHRRDPAAAGHAGSMGGLLDLLGVPPEARTFAALDAGERSGQLDAPHRLEPGRALPPPAPVFPRYVEPEAVK